VIMGLLESPWLKRAIAAAAGGMAMSPEESEAMKLYHGSRLGGGIYDRIISPSKWVHVGTKKQAEAMHKMGKIEEVDVGIKSPAVATRDANWDYDALDSLDALSYGGGVFDATKKEYWDVRKKLEKAASMEDMKKIISNELEKRGFDSIKYPNEVEGIGDSYIFWDRNLLNQTKVGVRDTAIQEEIPAKYISDIKKLGLSGLGLLGAYELAKPDTTEAMYIGPKATGWNNPALRKFTNLMDKMERAEISDAGAVGIRTINSNLMGKQVVPLRDMEHFKSGLIPDVFEHPRLYYEYPFLGNVLVTKDPGRKGGAYLNEHIYLGDKLSSEEIKPTLLHEIQHAIQEKEGWARGGSPTEMGSILNEPHPRLIELEQQWKDLQRLQPKTMSEQWDKTDKLNSIQLEMAQLKDKLKRQDPQEAYRSLAGEIEARDTAARMGLSEAQRASKMPYAGEGIPLKDAIVKMGVGAPVGAILAAEQMKKREMEKKYGGAVEESMNPLEYLVPSRLGGGLLNLGIDTIMNLFSR